MNAIQSDPMGVGNSVVAPQTSQTSTPKRKRCCCFFFKRKYLMKSQRYNVCEEAISWPNNFEKMLKNPVGQEIFQEFLRSQFSDENLRFWLAAEKYQTLSFTERKVHAKVMFNDFVSSISPCEVSLNARHKNEIEERLHEAEVDLYKHAQDYIFELMHRDCFPRFLKSRAYKRICR